jgi:glycosyl hydrolase family 59/glycosyl hydrolase family 59 (putative galactocerebrosidase)
LKVLAALALLATLAASNAVTPAKATATTVVINDGLAGRIFDGVGAISGGGGNSRLLVDYPPTQRSQILDYLFKPGYGAAVQLLKLEIGGDANSTDGSEPSHEHVRGDVNCNVGYEFWLGEQAVARNPDIKLVALPWTAPGWIGNGNFWSQDMIDYDISWLNCAKGHGLTISYLGGWNERGHDSGWYQNLRTSLNKAGYGGVRIVGDDTSWAMADDPALVAASDVLGSHYVCGYLRAATKCVSTANARRSGKPLWASEFGSQDDNAGVAPFIRTVNRGFLDAGLSGFMNWPLIAAMTPNLPFPSVGLMDAESPWSGGYRIGKNLWASAHYGQFTQPGWRYLNQPASGRLRGGSFVTLSHDRDYSTIYETSEAKSTQTVNVSVSGGLSTGTVHVWSTDLGSENPADYFARRPDVPVRNGSYSLTLRPNRIYSVTTTTGQGKGPATPPPAAPLALPYSDDFDRYAVRALPRYTQDMQGAFEIRPCAAGRPGQCLEQVTPLRPILWQGDSDAFTLLGDLSWADYTVRTDVDLRQPGTVTLLGRATTQGRPQDRQAAYQLRIGDTGAWSITRTTSAGTRTTLAAGTRPPLGRNRWHTIALTFAGSRITATLDGVTLAAVTDTMFATGQIGLGVAGYRTDQFDNLSVTPVPSA